MKFTKKDKIYYVLQQDTTYQVKYNQIIKKPKQINDSYYIGSIKRDVFLADKNKWVRRYQKVLLIKINKNNNIIYLNIT